jgi:Icc-related predicted phosphoesterase
METWAATACNMELVKPGKNRGGILRALCISDQVAEELDQPGVAKEVGPVDLLFSCGDLPPEYLSRLSDRFNAPLYYVRGNHDIRYAQSPPMGCINAHGRLIKHGKLKILGLEGSHWYNGGPCQYTEAQMRSQIRRLRPSLWWQRGVDIVLTHAPPRHVHDKEDQCHRGFESYVRLIERYHPRYFLHGHIHQSFNGDQERITDLGGTRVINCFKRFMLEINE